MAMKLTAAPVLLAIAMWRAPAGDGHAAARQAASFAATALGLAAVLVLPAALVSPIELMEHAVRFPAELTAIESPAASPLPGRLLAQTGANGRAAALALLALAALATLVWVLRWPPRTPAQAAERAASASSWP